MEGLKRLSRRPHLVENAKQVDEIKQLLLEVSERPWEIVPVYWRGWGKPEEQKKVVISARKVAQRGGVGALGGRRLQGARIGII